MSRKRRKNRRTDKVQPLHERLERGKRGLDRRQFLKGLGGVTLALPFLETFSPGIAEAQEDRPRYALFVRQGNGVQQGWNEEPDRFWPSQLGSITRDTLQADSDRAISELADYADRMLVVRGCNYPFPSYDCGHSSGIAQCLTAADHTGGTGNDDLALGMSVDQYISNQLTPDVGPLTLVAARPQAYIGANLSYSGPQQRNSAESNPYNVYLRLFADNGMDQEVINQLAIQRNSVNDLVREELQYLRSRDLSQNDRDRLDRHLSSIRDLETTMACEGLSEAAIMDLELVRDDPEGEDVRDLVVQLHAKLIALAFACDMHRACTLQIGTGNDQTKYYINGNKLQYSFHWISHRRESDGSDGPLIDGADMLHHQIDRKFANYFKTIIEELDGQVTIAGRNLLDESAAVWLNDLSNGPPHGRNNLPYVIAGSAGGFLRQGQYVDAGDVTHNQFLNTVINATGIRKQDGSMVDDFGDSSLDRGVIDNMLA